MATGNRSILGLALAGALLAATTWPSHLRAETPTGTETQKSSRSSTASSHASKKPKSQTHPTKTEPVKKPAGKSATSAVPKKQSPPLVFTDEDLQRYHVGQTAAPVRNTPPAPVTDPLKGIHEEQEREAWRQKRAAELQQKVTDLEARLKTLEKRKLSIKNPLVPRVPDPDGNPEAEIGMSGPELLARTDEEINVTSQQLDAARKELANFVDKKPE